MRSLQGVGCSSSSSSSEFRVPKQDNSCDCGIFALMVVETILRFHSYWWHNPIPHGESSITINPQSTQNHSHSVKGRSHSVKELIFWPDASFSSSSSSSSNSNARESSSNLSLLVLAIWVWNFNSCLMIQIACIIRCISVS
jgi:hypothetical protein